MTSHQENLKVVEAAVRKACPETLERVPMCLFKDCDSCQGEYDENTREVPLTLEHVLRALWKRNESWGNVYITGERHSISKELSEVLFRWIFGKPLHDQDEPTIDFLASVLCKEKTT